MSNSPAHPSHWLKAPPTKILQQFLRPWSPQLASLSWSLGIVSSAKKSAWAYSLMAQWGSYSMLYYPSSTTRFSNRSDTSGLSSTWCSGRSVITIDEIHKHLDLVSFHDQGSVDREVIHAKVKVEELAWLWCLQKEEVGEMAFKIREGLLVLFVPGKILHMVQEFK